ncbi:MAG: hypothetical protein IPJ74_25995 [Saprospiraceae bacterium]|nr:hypothetical protein [Saprospiraceae bacterium]
MRKNFSIHPAILAHHPIFLSQRTSPSDGTIHANIFWRTESSIFVPLATTQLAVEAVGIGFFAILALPPWVLLLYPALT